MLDSDNAKVNMMLKSSGNQSELPTLPAERNIKHNGLTAGTPAQEQGHAETFPSDNGRNNLPSINSTIPEMPHHTENADDSPESGRQPKIMNGRSTDASVSYSSYTGTPRTSSPSSISPSVTSSRPTPRIPSSATSAMNPTIRNNNVVVGRRLNPKLTRIERLNHSPAHSSISSHGSSTLSTSKGKQVVNWTGTTPPQLPLRPPHSMLGYPPAKAAQRDVPNATNFARGPVVSLPIETPQERKGQDFALRPPSALANLGKRASNSTGDVTSGLDFVSLSDACPLLRGPPRLRDRLEQTARGRQSGGFIDQILRDHGIDPTRVSRTDCTILWYLPQIDTEQTATPTESQQPSLTLPTIFWWLKSANEQERVEVTLDDFIKWLRCKQDGRRLNIYCQISEAQLMNMRRRREHHTVVDEMLKTGKKLQPSVSNPVGIWFEIYQLLSSRGIPEKDVDRADLAYLILLPLEEGAAFLEGLAGKPIPRACDDIEGRSRFSFDRETELMPSRPRNEGEIRRGSGRASQLEAWWLSGSRLNRSGTSGLSTRTKPHESEKLKGLGEVTRPIEFPEECATSTSKRIAGAPRLPESSMRYHNSCVDRFHPARPLSPLPGSVTVSEEFGRRTKTSEAVKNIGEARRITGGPPNRMIGPSREII
jgi:hypothetical protein